MLIALATMGLGLAAQVRGNSSFTPLPNGISVKAGDEPVELTVATPFGFRLHLFGTVRKDSIFLSGGNRTPAAFTVVHEGKAVAIRTGFGELLVDPDREMWSMRDSSGNVLADWAPLGRRTRTVAGVPAATPQPASADHPATRGKPAVPPAPAGIDFFIGKAPKYPHALFYASGNVQDLGSLVQSTLNSRTGNGNTGLPQYWSPAGFGVIALGQDDRHPASWKEHFGGTDWFVPGDGVDLYLMPAPTLYDWVRDDAEMTGFAPVPPRWAFGYMQSRWGWTDRAYIDDTLARFRKDNLPVDAFIFDFEWYTVRPDYSVPPDGDPKFVDFGWNPKLMPDPAGQLASYLQQGLHIIGIRKPRLGNQQALADARDKGWILPHNPGDPNSGSTTVRNIDFSNPDAQAWWIGNNRKFPDAGMAGFWNDEGETTYVEYTYWNFCENELFAQARPNQRFFSLNRSFAPGMQRLGAAAWTGDINGDWKTIRRTPGELLSYGLSGMPYSTCDIGGFNGQDTPELLTRWMQSGVFYPVMRSHSSHALTPRFPWLYGADAEAAIRDALDLRYRLIPYYESLAHEAAATGAPLMRPLVMEFQSDPRVANMTDEWLMGQGLLAAPVLNEGGARTVYLPADKWYDFGTGHATKGPKDISVTATLDQIPVYVRAGTLLPLGPVRQYTGQASDAPLELQIYPGRGASFTFVEDDGGTLDYQKGVMRRTVFTWNDQSRTLSWKVEGNYKGPNLFTQMKVVLFSPHGKRSIHAALGRDGALSFH